MRVRMNFKKSASKSVRKSVITEVLGIYRTLMSIQCMPESILALRNAGRLIWNQNNIKQLFLKIAAETTTLDGIHKTFF